NTYEVERDVIMQASETVTVGDYVFRLEAVGQRPGPNYIADRATISVLKGSRLVASLRPERRVYTAAQSASPMTEAAIDTGPTRDLYVALGESMGGGAWIVRIYVKPFVAWIWGGGIMM